MLAANRKRSRVVDPTRCCVATRSGEKWQRKHRSDPWGERTREARCGPRRSVAIDKRACRHGVLRIEQATGPLNEPSHGTLGKRVSRTPDGEINDHSPPHPNQHDNQASGDSPARWVSRIRLRRRGQVDGERRVQSIIECATSGPCVSCSKYPAPPIVMWSTFFAPAVADVIDVYAFHRGQRPISRGRDSPRSMTFTPEARCNNAPT